MRWSGGSFAAWAAGMLLSLGVAAAESPPSPVLFTGRPHDFERSSDKVVGVYVPSWQPVALVDGLPGGNWYLTGYILVSSKFQER